MRIVLGLLVCLLGFALSLLSLALTASVNGRLILVVIGMAMTLVGIIALINRACVKNAIWRK
jgi:hypothetical protein